MRNSVLKNITNAVEKSIKEGSIIITSEGVCQNLDVYGKWKLIDISILSKANTTRDERPLKPIRNEYASKLYNLLYGREFKNQLIKDLNQWTSGKIFLIAYRNDIEIIKNIIGDRFAIDKKALNEMANFDLPVRKELMHNNKARMGFEKQKITMTPMPRHPMPPHPVPRHPVGPNHIFDFEIRKEPLVVVELAIK